MQTPNPNSDSNWFDNYSAFSTEPQPVDTPEVVTDPLPGTVDWLFVGYDEVGGES